jgi:hypothetical protein
VIDRLGNTPLSEVQKLKHDELIEVLKKNGARDIDVTTLPTSASSAALMAGMPRMNSFFNTSVPSVSPPESSSTGGETANGMA